MYLYNTERVALDDKGTRMTSSETERGCDSQ
jgi:hypothetical protein